MKKFPHGSKKQVLGAMGELLVAQYLSTKGFECVLSETRNDKHKDMVNGDKLVEVKTQVIFRDKNAFTIRPSQLKKCLSVDELYFVSVPSKDRLHPSDGKIYVIEKPKKNLKWRSHTTRTKRKMVLIPIKQKHLREVVSLSLAEISMLRELTSEGENG